jgi:hypothetical protein
MHVQQVVILLQGSHRSDRGSSGTRAGVMARGIENDFDNINGLIFASRHVSQLWGVPRGVAQATRANDAVMRINKG